MYKQPELGCVCVSALLHTTPGHAESCSVCCEIPSDSWLFHSEVQYFPSVLSLGAENKIAFLPEAGGWFTRDRGKGEAFLSFSEAVPVIMLASEPGLISDQVRPSSAVSTNMWAWLYFWQCILGKRDWKVHPQTVFCCFRCRQKSPACHSNTK